MLSWPCSSCYDLIICSVCIIYRFQFVSFQLSVFAVYVQCALFNVLSVFVRFQLASGMLSWPCSSCYGILFMLSVFVCSVCIIYIYIYIYIYVLYVISYDVL